MSSAARRRRVGHRGASECHGPGFRNRIEGRARVRKRLLVRENAGADHDMIEVQVNNGTAVRCGAMRCGVTLTTAGCLPYPFRCAAATRGIRRLTRMNRHMRDEQEQRQNPRPEGADGGRVPGCKWSNHCETTIHLLRPLVNTATKHSKAKGARALPLAAVPGEAPRCRYVNRCVAPLRGKCRRRRGRASTKRACRGSPPRRAG